MVIIIITLHSIDPNMTVHVCSAKLPVLTLHSSDPNITCHVISPQLTVQCHVKKTAPCKMRRGSATSDIQYAYIMPWDSRSVYRYEWSTQEWDKLPPCPYRDSALVIIDGALTAVGGCYTNKLATLRERQWVEELPPMKTLHAWTAVVSTPDEEYVLVIGGGDGRWTTTVELFEVRRKKWSELTHLPQPLSNPSATICGNHICVIGGDCSGFSCSLHDLPSSYQPTTLQLRPRTISWSPLPPLPVTRSTAATICGQLAIIGGMQGKSSVNSIHQLVDGQWEEIGSMSSDRCWCLVVHPSLNNMMIVGGLKTNSVEECVVV